jgi:hypothetical protein
MDGTLWSARCGLVNFARTAWSSRIDSMRAFPGAPAMAKGCCRRPGKGAADLSSVPLRSYDLTIASYALIVRTEVPTLDEK